MKNVEVSLANNSVSLVTDYSSGSGGVCRLDFISDEHDDIWVMSTHSEDDTQHDLSLTEADWKLLKKKIDKLFKDKRVNKARKRGNT
jgi:hypothetical protein